MGTIYVDTGGSATNSGSNDGAAIASGTAATLAGVRLTLDGNPNLSGLSTSGPTQSAIFLNQATNANRKVFWITAFDDAANWVDVDTAPTGIVSSAWTIGGQFSLTDVTPTMEGAVRGGDTVIFNNSPPARASNRSFFTGRIAGSQATGLITIKGKSGLMPSLTFSSGNGNGLSVLSYTLIDNLECRGYGSMGIAIQSGTGCIVRNSKAYSATSTQSALLCTGDARIYNCDVEAPLGNGIQAVSTDQNVSVEDCYIHDCGIDGLVNVARQYLLAHNNLIVRCVGRGINISETVTVTGNRNRKSIQGNTIYGCGNAGLETADVDVFPLIRNNIIAENGYTAGVANAIIFTGTIFGYNSNNCFYKASGTNVTGLTLDSTDITTDPQFVDAASNDFSLQDTSPCIGAGNNPGLVQAGYRSMGAIQPLPVALADAPAAFENVGF